MKKKRRILSTFLAACMIASCFTGMSIPASADGETSYTITIPETLTVNNSGWNSIGNISASGTLASGKKLKVEATSANNWALTSTSDSVSYTLNNGSDTKGDAATSWEFTTLPATQAIGIDVADYSDKPAGTYQDTVTFTASVEDALTYIEVGKKYNRDIYLDNVKFYYIPGETYREAVQKHGQESGMNWNIYEGSNNTTIYWNSGDGDLYINNKNNFATGSSAYCGFTLDSVVDPNQTYTHDIYP